jgi:excisionase family DNA binding protein
MSTTVERATYTVADAAVRLGIDKLTLYSAIRRGESPFPTIRVGRRLLIPKAALDRLLEGEVEGAS